jgi:predicted ATPase/class 3 adenylate cyclase/Tfp pilus assembly protein PilF
MTSRTFLFTDIEGSTQRWERFPEEMRRDLARHDALLREAITSAGGSVFKTVGDAFYAVFGGVEAASQAAVAIQRGLASESFITGPIKVRIAIHTGEAESREADYFGPTLNRVARILSAGHGGQVLISSAARAELNGTHEVLDLGERRLKDLARPERIFQLVAPGLTRDFPPLRTLEQRPHKVPAQPNEFIGRQAQLAEVRALLRAPSTRLLTLTGPGGTGKSRLSMQLATEALDSFEDGVFWIPLAAVREASQVPVAIIAGLSAPVREPGELLHWSENRQLLVVLDNFEQVLDAARFVSQWLEAAPRLKLVVTSRSRLKLAGEHEWPVPALNTAPVGGPAEALARSEAVQLFVTRARAVRPGFELTPQNAAEIAELCARLDGLPLALELAAARVRLLPPRALLERIRAGGVLPLLSSGASDLPGRQQTLRRTIEWSYELLTQPDRAALRAFSVFSGGADLEAANAVLGDDALERIDSLVGGSLLQTVEVNGEPRFTVLETVREFAHDALVAANEEPAVARRHATHFIRLAQAICAPIVSGSKKADLAPLDREHANVQAALRWTQAAGERELHRSLCEAVWPYWELRGHWDEGRRALDFALSGAEGADDRQLANVLLAAGALAATQGDFADAEPLLARAHATFLAAGDEPHLTAALRRLAFSAAYGGRYRQAADLLEQACAMLEKVGTLNDRIEAMMLLAWAVAELGDLDRGEELCRQGLVLGQKLNEPGALIHVYNAYGELARAKGELENASERYGRALSIARELGNRRWMASALANLAVVRLRQGQVESAGAMFSEALALNIELGNRRNVPSMMVGIAELARLSGERVAAARLLAFAENDLREKKVRLPFADHHELERVRPAIHAGAEPSAPLTLDQALAECDRVLRTASSR